MIEMNYQNRFVGLLCMGCAIMFLTAGCEQNAASPYSTINVAGTWELIEEDEITSHVLELEQNNTLLTGTMTAFFGTTAPAVGFLSGDSISLIITLDAFTNSVVSSNSFAGTVTFAGTIAQDTNSMSGDWWNSSEGEGTWTAERSAEDS